MRCKICKKTPSELREYVLNEEDMNPYDFVREFEGTYNEETDEFYCTKCYINVGMPLGKA